MKIQRSRKTPRRGIVLVLAAFLMVVIFGMVAFAVDVGYITFVKSQLQRSSDAAAHAAVIELVTTDKVDKTIAKAKELASYNQAAGENVIVEDADVWIGRRNLIAGSSPAAYNYDWTQTAGANAVKVIARKTKTSAMGPLALFFAPVMGIKEAEVSSNSVAVLAPRDIVFVIDVSGSMHHDTEPWALNALNWLSTDSSGKGAGDAAMELLWSDLGLTGKAPYPLPNTSQYRWNMSSDSNNLVLQLPGSPSSYTSISVTNNGGVAETKLNISEIKTMIQNPPFVTTSGGTKTKISDPNWNAYAWRSSTDGNVDIKAYDLIIDKILPKIMPDAKPSLATQANRDAYREYWRGYLNYTRGSSGLNSGAPGDGTGSGIQGFSNPTSENPYTRPNGTTYSQSSLNADAAALTNRVDYMTYIQFMMDMSYSRKPGLDSNGNQASSSLRKYTPMSGLSTASSSDKYRWTDSNGYTRFVREQPQGSMVDAIIAGLQQIKADNPSSVPTNQRDHVAMVIFAQNYQTITTHPSDSTNPFTYDYDACMTIASQLQAEKQVGASTNTHGGLTQARSSISSKARQYTNRFVILFSDGVPNTGSTPGPYDSTTKIDTNGDGSLDSNYYYSNSTTYKYENAALTAAQLLNNDRVVVHTVCCGGGRDTDLMRRMSLLTRGIARDSGSNLHEYAGNLTKDIKDLANAKVPKMTIITSGDTETH